MVQKKIILVAVLVLIANHTLFAQAVGIDTAISNAVSDISGSIPGGATIAVLNITSEHEALSNFIINELILNLIRTGLFYVVPRTTVEMELVRQELLFQRDDEMVNPETQARLRRFAGADTLISGELSRETPNTYRLMITAIHSETFIFQAAYATSVQIDGQMRTLIGGTGAVVPVAPVAAVHVEDFTVGERLRMGFFNMFFGAGSIANRQHLGWAVAGGQSIGLLITILGATWYIDPYFYDEDRETQRTLLMTGGGIIGAAILFGYIIPFFHTRPAPRTASSNNLPFDVELVSGNNRGINGFRVSHTIRF